MRIVINVYALIPLIGAILMIAGLSASWISGASLPGWELVSNDDFGTYPFTLSIGIALVVPIAILTAVPAILSLIFREYSGRARLAKLPIILTVFALLFIMDGGLAFLEQHLDFDGAGYMMSMAGLILGAAGQILNNVMTYVGKKISVKASQAKDGLRANNGCVIIYGNYTNADLSYQEGKSRTWDDKMYLYPIPTGELQRNENLLPQNPGW